MTKPRTKSSWVHLARVPSRLRWGALGAAGASNRISEKCKFSSQKSGPEANPIQLVPRGSGPPLVGPMCAICSSLLDLVRALIALGHDHNQTDGGSCTLRVPTMSGPSEL